MGVRIANLPRSDPLKLRQCHTGVFNLAGEEGLGAERARAQEAELLDREGLVTAQQHRRHLVLLPQAPVCHLGGVGHGEIAVWAWAAPPTDTHAAV